MSRAASQLTVPSRHIFITPIKQSDGTIKSVMSSKPLSDQSIRVNSTWQGKKWNGEKSTDTETGNWSNSGALFLLTTVWVHPLFLDKKNKKQFLCPDVLQYIVGTFILGVDFATAENVSQYAIAITRPRFFPQILRDRLSEYGMEDVTLFGIVDAAMRGQEDIVLNILNADPRYLLAKAKVKNSVGVEYEVTPLQAAIMANDIQLAERMKEHFARLTTDLNDNPIDGLAEMHRQIKEITMQSLTHYHTTLLPEALKKLEAEQLALLQLPTDLDAAQTKRYKTIVEKIKQITNSMLTCRTVLQRDDVDIHEMLEAHNQAQEANAFDFDIYVKAICNASQAELDVVMELINSKTSEEIKEIAKRTGVIHEAAEDIAKRTGVSPTEIGFIKDGKTYTREEVQALPFDQLTLVQKLNRFREKSVEHMQQEIILNPNHILTGLKINEAAWNDYYANRFTDPGYKKLSVIFSQLAGRLQEKAAEPVKQDIRQGTYYLIEKNEPRARPSRFNTWDAGMSTAAGLASEVDVSLVSAVSFDGLGYKFACAEWGEGRSGICGGGGRWLWPEGRRCVGFQNLCRAKTAGLENLCSQRSHHASLAAL